MKCMYLIISLPLRPVRQVSDSMEDYNYDVETLLLDPALFKNLP
jgi:hypothetical protein